MESLEENIGKLVGKGNIFTLPGGYFENLPARILALNNAIDDFIDDGYTKGNAVGEIGIEYKLKAISSDRTESIENENEPKSYPTDVNYRSYFEGLHSRIMARIGFTSSHVSRFSEAVEEETEAAIKVLTTRGIPRSESSSIFQIPNGYFENQNDRLNEKLGSREGIKRAALSEIKTIKFTPLTSTNNTSTKKSKIVTLWAKPLVRFTAAATIAGLFALSVLQIRTNITNSNDYANRIAPEDRFLSRYDIDESIVEEELVSPHSGAGKIEPSNNSKSASGDKQQKSDTYILEHADEHTLVEEI